MVSGEIAVRIEDETDVAGAGTVVFIPRGTRHTFANPGEAPARLLALLTPGGFEHYFDALAQALEAAGGIPAPDELAALGEAYGSMPA